MNSGSEAAKAVICTKIFEGMAKKSEVYSDVEIQKQLDVPLAYVQRYMLGIIPGTNELRERLALYLGYDKDAFKPDVVDVRLEDMFMEIERYQENKNIKKDNQEVLKIVDDIEGLSKEDFDSLVRILNKIRKNN